MAYPKILTIQDISCMGQCSLTVALPIISACGVETCVLPSAVLSTHTGGFTGLTFRDLTEDMPSINNHWQKEGIKFDAVYTGYLGSAKQIEYVKEIVATSKKVAAPFIVDPAMADNGKLYAGFDDAFVQEMKELCRVADYVLPNITEACLLTDTEYKEEYDRAYIDDILEKLCALGCKNIIMTGISYNDKTTGVVIMENGVYNYYEHIKLPRICHGTGDIYASTFVGSLTRGKSAYAAAKLAADYTLECVKATMEEEGHWYGAKFEPVLPYLINEINK
jgi:pyridoxine kinase